MPGCVPVRPASTQDAAPLWRGTPCCAHGPSSPGSPSSWSRLWGAPLLSSPPTGLRFTDCRYSSLGYDCFYSSTDVGLWYIDMRVEGGASAGYRVVSVNAQMRFGGPDAAARYVLKAWLEGDRAKARRAASESVVDALGATSAGCANRGMDVGTPARLIGASARPSCPMFADRAAAEPADRTGGDRRATGSRQALSGGARTVSVALHRLPAARPGFTVGVLGGGP